MYEESYVLFSRLSVRQAYLADRQRRREIFTKESYLHMYSCLVSDWLNQNTHKLLINIDKEQIPLETS